MKIQRQAPEVIAATLIRLAGRNGERINPERVRANYLDNARCMREIAEKARASKNGKARGFAADDAERLARQAIEYSELVPAAIRALYEGAR
jgi:hypothetical protein